jgi:galactokinase
VSVEDFRTTYGTEPAGLWSAPGRVNLIGEHTDYNDGFVLPFAIEARTRVAAAARDDGVLRMRSAQQPTGDVAVPVDDLAPGTPDGWGSYVAGIIWAARRSGHAVGGMDVLVDGRVPLGGGLSSSHALECGVALAVNDIFELGLDTQELALLTQRAENDFVGAPTGLMDQLASLGCTAGHALFLDTRTLRSEQIPLDPAADNLTLLVVDTRVHHELGDGSYGDRRSGCEEAARQLGVESLRDVPADGLDDRLSGLPDDLRRRARHVVGENDRVLAAVSAIKARDWPALGKLLDASHASLRDDYEVSCAELDSAVDAAVAAGALGARMTGGGFGGSAIALVPDARVAAVRSAVADAFETRGWQSPRTFSVTPSAGAGRDV